MRTFNSEVKSILFALEGSAWAPHPEVRAVIAEYKHLQDAWKVLWPKRRVALQILHASRALDSLLKHMVEHERARVGRLGQPGRHLTLGSSLREIQRDHIQGRSFSTPTKSDIEQLTHNRNTYLHEANNFPNDPLLQQFLSRTIRAINEAMTFPA